MKSKFTRNVFIKFEIPLHSCFIILNHFQQPSNGILGFEKVFSLRSAKLLTISGLHSTSGTLVGMGTLVCMGTTYLRSVETRT